MSYIPFYVLERLTKNLPMQGGTGVAFSGFRREDLTRMEVKNSGGLRPKGGHWLHLETKGVKKPDAVNSGIP